MLIRFGKKSKAQSTAEYALVIAAVVGVLATMQVMMKGAMKKKSAQALNYYEKQGDDILGQYGDDSIPLYEQRDFQSQVFSEGYRSERVTQKGGAEQQIMEQKTKRTGTSVETKTGSE